MKFRHSTLDRRTFLGGTAALTTSMLCPHSLTASSQVKPNSKFNGVQIGAITYSFRSLPGSAEELLGYIRGSIKDMISLLDDPDLNQAGEENFAKVEKKYVCLRCNFLKVCKPRL